MMKLPKVLTRTAMIAATLFTLSVVFSSCHREACPGQITDVEQIEQQMQMETALTAEADS